MTVGCRGGKFVVAGGADSHGGAVAAGGTSDGPPWAMAAMTGAETGGDACGFEADPEAVRHEERWVCDGGEGAGSYSQVANMEMVGAGKGEFEKERYTTVGGSRVRACCVGFLTVIAILLPIAWVNDWWSAPIGRYGMDDVGGEADLGATAARYYAQVKHIHVHHTVPVPVPRAPPSQVIMQHGRGVRKTQIRHRRHVTSLRPFASSSSIQTVPMLRESVGTTNTFVKNRLLSQKKGPAICQHRSQMFLVMNLSKKGVIFLRGSHVPAEDANGDKVLHKESMVVHIKRDQGSMWCGRKMSPNYRKWEHGDPDFSQLLVCQQCDRARP
eukprot:s1113_g13.t1